MRAGANIRYYDGYVLDDKDQGANIDDFSRTHSLTIVAYLASTSVLSMEAEMSLIEVQAKCD